MSAESNINRDKSDLQKILNGLSRAAKGDQLQQIQVSGDNQDLTAIALAINALLKSVRAVADESRDEKKQLEARVKKLQMIYESAPDVILLVNKYGTIVDINRRIKKFLGYDPEDLKGRHFAKLEGLADGIRSELLAAFKEAMAEGPLQVRRDVELQTKNGNRRLVEVGTALLRNDQSDEIEGAVVVLRDVTVRRQMEQDTQNQLRKLHQILSSMEELVFILDKNLCFTAYFQAPDLPAPSIFSMPEDYLGKSVRDVFPREVTQHLEKAIRACLRSQKSQKFDFSWTTLGATLWFNTRVAVLTDEAGEATNITVVIRDITQRKQIEQALAASEKKYRKIFDHSPQGFILLDTEGRIIDINRRICDWLGYKREDIIRKDHVSWPFLTKQGKVLAMKKFYQRLSGKVVPAYNLEFVNKRGEIFIGEVQAMQIRDDEGRITQVLAMITDISSPRPDKT